MHRIAMIAVAVAVTAGSALGFQAAGRDVEALYRTHQWFELRRSVTSESPALIRAALAAAFNDPERAESLLRSIIETVPSVHVSSTARPWGGNGQGKADVDSCSWSRFGELELRTC